jgi:hypothetical protein
MRMSWRIIIAAFSLTFAPAWAADMSEQDTRTFSAKNQQADLARLRNFVYPEGYTDQTIVALENDIVPAELSVPDFARLHCGESNRFVLNPCIIRYPEATGPAFYVVVQGANMRFGDLASAVDYYRRHIAEITQHFQNEVDVLNVFVDEFCAQIAAGARAADILRARGGDRPRINHAIASPDPNAKYQFSNLFSWERCTDCVGIIAVNQPAEAPAPTCGALRKQSPPHIAYFVVDRTTSKGRGSLDDTIAHFTQLAATR